MEEKTTSATGADEELDAMRAVSNALRALDAASARRVLQWAAERFGIEPGTSRAVGLSAHHAANDLTTADDLAGFFAEAAPQTGPEKALVVGYYQQIVQGASELDAQALNSELKHLGHGLPNITNSMSLLMNQNPSLVIQTKKMGKEQQARKRYKLTNAGIVRVREMLARAKAGG